MIYLVYLILVPISLLLTLIGVALAPVMVLFNVQKLWWCNNHSYQAVGPVLPTWLDWFNTPDNTLDGDTTFQQLFPVGSYWSKVHWLWRNPAYSFALCYLNTPYDTVVKGDPTIKDNDNAKEGHCLVISNGLFQFRLVKRIFSTSRCLYFNFGWNILGLADPNVNPKPNQWQATFVFSPRISGFR
jgi:hypothetical protein